MPQEMTPDARRAFLTEGARTAVLATTRADGRPHAVPVWYGMDGDDILVNITAETVKGKALRRDPRVTVVVDDDAPPYAFVMVEGDAELVGEPGALRVGSEIIARHYLDGPAVDGWLEYATGPDKVLVRIRPTRVVAVDKVGA
jgi:PPOX class probable F420-dependent enzyme